MMVFFKFFSNGQFTLHVFVDISMKAYGAVAYICDDTRLSFVMAKARVAPMKGHILPRLELMAVLTSSRLCKFISMSLDHLRFNIIMWSDSQIALCWLSSKKKLKPFVTNRVNEIQELLPNATWKYIPTHDNPADLVTRGISFDSLNDSQLWRCHPTWLTCKSQWPTWEQSEVLHLQGDEGIITEPTGKADRVSSHRGDLSLVMDIDRFSSLQKLLRVSAYVLRFIHNCKQSDKAV